MAKFLDHDKLEGASDRKIARVNADPELSPKNKELITKYVHEARLGKTIKKGGKKRINEGRLLQSIGILVLMCKEWFLKDLDQVNDQDMESFILSLDQGKILTVRNGAGRPYSHETRSNIKKFIRKFYKWMLTDGYNYPGLVDWIDTSKQENVISAIPGLKDGVWRIVELIPDLRRKAMTWVCFDSGFRLSELVNLTVGDVEKRSDGVYYVTCHHSKTARRTVSLPYSSDLLDRWLQEHPLKHDRTAQLWQTSRARFYQTVKLYGYKSLGISINPHMLRHTSATFYSTKLDRVSFCKRFGWSYSSRTPDRYIDFNKTQETKVVDIVRADQYSEMKQELEDERVARTTMQQQLTEQSQKFKELEKAIKYFSNKK